MDISVADLGDWRKPGDIPESPVSRINEDSGVKNLYVVVRTLLPDFATSPFSAAYFALLRTFSYNVLQYLQVNSHK